MKTLSLLLLLNSGLVFADTPRMPPVSAPSSDSFDRFSTLVPLTVSGKNALQKIVLTPEIYESCALARCADLRVFNGKKEHVPFAVEWPSDKREEKWSLVSFYPLYGKNVDTVGDLRFVPQRDSEGKVIDVKSLPKKGDVKKERLLGYLIQLNEQPVAALRLAWKDKASFFLNHVTVEQSTDLEHWSPVKAEGSLVNLAYQNSDLVRNTIDLTDIYSPFLRITWDSNFSGVNLKSVEALVRSYFELKPTERGTKDLKSQYVSNPQGSFFLADTGGAFPVDTVEVFLAQTNSVTPLALETSDSPDGPWRKVYEGNFYRVYMDDKLLVNESLHRIGVGGRYWKIIPRKEDAAMQAEPPTLRVSWKPEPFLFIAQGEGPFWLATGNAKAGKPDPKNRDLVSTIKPLGNDIPQATVSKPQTQDVPPPVEIPVKKDVRPLILWFVLGFGVILLGVFAFKLAKEMKD